ncbi:MAG: acyltransferase [Lachnospiraceae bacterium]|nr:acyltransferase [Lachnospiraceae bacterium]
MIKIRAVLQILKAYLKPYQYVRDSGIKFSGGGQIALYGNPYKIFGSDPYMITLGDNVHITSGVRFITHDGGTLILRKEVPDLEITKPIKVGNDVYFGVNSIIMPGVTIGNRCIVAAGAIVTKDVPDNSVVAGVPARVVKSTDDYLEKIKGESLHLGHLKGEEKAQEIKKFYHIE